VYKAEVAPSGEGWIVNFWFGPRTGTLQSGTKTKAPVSKDEALKIWERVVREKKAKGYHEGTDAPAYTESDGSSRDTGLRPMLLTPATEEELMTFLGDPEWGAQEKLNGKRILIRSAKGTVVAANRRGLACSIPKEVASWLAECEGVFDGEMVGSTYIPFDLLEAQGGDCRSAGYEDRHAMLRFLLAGRKGIAPAPLAFTAAEKRSLYDALKRRNAEGIVFKRLAGAGYTPGAVVNLARAHAVKIKFYASLECEVIGWNSGRQSIGLGVYDASGELVCVGNVTVPMKYATDIVARSVVQVRYLYL
jgi:bifunctional non-homologous end joining protein LigD